jgi:hypothetical protein
MAKAAQERLRGGPLRLIRLQAESADDQDLVNRLGGVVAAGPGLDVFWAEGFNLRAKQGATRPGPVLFVMKERGRLRRAWDQAGAPEHVSSAAFDGRFVWLATSSRQRPPALFVFDPAAEKAYEVTADDGLPLPSAEQARGLGPGEYRDLAVTGLDPGRACVAGSFGRGWVALAKFDPNTKKATVKVLHEACELPRQEETEKQVWQNRKLVFQPSYAYTLRGAPAADGKVAFRVLVGRQITHAGRLATNNTAFLAYHPLVIDPDRLTVEVLQDSLSLPHFRNATVVADGTLLTAFGLPTKPGQLFLARAEFPGVVRDLGRLDIPSTAAFPPCGVSDGRLYVATDARTPTRQPGGGMFLGSVLWSADPDGKHARKVKDDLLHVRGFARSSHYGLVAWCDLYPGICLSEVTEPARPRK